MPRIAVVGAGAVGLSTAVQLLQKFPDAKVTVIAKEFYKDTTSYGAAGLCRPTFEKVPGVPFQVYRQWLADSWQYYDSLAHSPDSEEAGVQMVSGFEFYNEDRDTSLEKAVIYDHRECTEKEMSLFPGQRYSNGYKATTLMTECKSFLPYLMKRFKASGGKTEHKELKSLSELVGKYDLVMNCSGLGSRTLVADQHTYPSRGHVFRVIAPWVKHFIYIEDGRGNYTWIYPGKDDVIIGGTKEDGNEHLTPKKSDRDGIWQRAYEIMPSLKKATLKSEWVGLRPMRKPLRLEKETMKFTEGSITVIHNYGHGGEGVNLSWGTACHGVRLATEYLQPTARL